MGYFIWNLPYGTQVLATRILVLGTRILWDPVQWDSRCRRLVVPKMNTVHLAADHQGVEAHWYALRVKPQHEKAVARSLEQRALAGFLPLYRSLRTWSDRTQEVDLPLFDGYVFCRFSQSDRVRVIRTPGVLRIVGYGGTPCAVTDSEIEAIQRAVSSGLAVMPWSFLRAGMKGRIDHGSLRGLEGILIREKDHWRVVVSVAMLQRSVAVEVDRAFVSVARDLKLPVKTQGVHNDLRQLTYAQPVPR
jgi:transcription antitermination factor NusG